MSDRFYYTCPNCKEDFCDPFNLVNIDGNDGILECPTCKRRYIAVTNLEEVR
jgi:DNA-directed RNA polymerase subunit RPC12/RpoP